jgi:hypothetical protein
MDQVIEAAENNVKWMDKNYHIISAWLENASIEEDSRSV